MPFYTEAKYNLGLCLLASIENRRGCRLSFQQMVWRVAITNHANAQYQMGKILRIEGNLKDGLNTSGKMPGPRLSPQRDYMHYQLAGLRPEGKAGFSDATAKLEI